MTVLTPIHVFCYQHIRGSINTLIGKLFDKTNFENFNFLNALKSDSPYFLLTLTENSTSLYSETIDHQKSFTGVFKIILFK